MSSVRFETWPGAAGKRSFFSIAASLVSSEEGASLLRRFFPEGHGTSDPRPPHKLSDGRLVERWLEFLRGEASYLVVEDADLERAEGFVEHIMEEAVNRPGFDSSISRGRDGGGRWKPHRGQAPIVISEVSTCYGCGKVHVGDRMDGRQETLGWRLEVGPYEVPCCPGKDDGFKKECRLKVVDRLSCCPSCGRLDKTRVGKVCRECLQLVELGEKARAMTGKTAFVELGNWVDPHLPHETRKQVQLSLEFVLVSMGGRTYGDSGRAQVPELAVPEIRALIERVNEAIRLSREQGVRQGTDLLGGLASGRVSVADFNDKTWR